MFQLRPCQSAAIKDSLSFVKSGNKEGVMVLPTGAGKSIVIAEIIKELGADFGNVLILQPSGTLLKQNYQKYISYGFEASIFSASLKQKNIGRVTFATPKTVKNDLYSFKNISLIIIDEVHLASKESNALGELDRYFKCPLLGLTATPFINKSTMAGYALSFLHENKDSLVKTLIHVTQVSEVAQYWNPIKYLEPKEELKRKVLAKNTSGGDYTEFSMNLFYEINEIENKIIQTISFLKEKGINKILIFVPSIIKAQLLAARVFGSVPLHSQLSVKEQDALINGFREGKIEVLINVGILGIGYDHPSLQAIIHARPLTSFALWYQHVGRLIRMYDIKKYFVDLAGNVKKFGKIEEIEIKKEGNNFNLYCSNKRINQRVNPYKRDIMDFPYKFKFGKYLNYQIGAVIRKEPRYIYWIATAYKANSPDEHEAVSVCRQIINMAVAE